MAQIGVLGGSWDPICKSISSEADRETNFKSIGDGQGMLGRCYRAYKKNLLSIT